MRGKFSTPYQVTILDEPVSGSVIKELAEVLAQAYADEPSIKYVFRDEERRLETLRYLYEQRLNLTLKNSLGEVWIARDVSTGKYIGCAIWARSGLPIKALGRLMAKLARFMLKRRLQNSEWKRRETMYGYFDQAHEKVFHGVDVPCLELSLIGVIPEAQRNGIGNALVEPVINRAKNNKMPCYVFVFVPNPKAEEFYRRNDFVLVAQGQAGDSGLGYNSMLRLGDIELLRTAALNGMETSKRRRNTPSSSALNRIRKSGAASSEESNQFVSRYNHRFVKCR